MAKRNGREIDARYSHVRVAKDSLARQWGLAAYAVQEIDTMPV